MSSSQSCHRCIPADLGPVWWQGMSMSLDRCLINTGVPQDRSTRALGCAACADAVPTDIPAVLPLGWGLLQEIKGLLLLLAWCSAVVTERCRSVVLLGIWRCFPAALRCPAGSGTLLHPLVSPSVLCCDRSREEQRCENQRKSRKHESSCLLPSQPGVPIDLLWRS